jgi:hypothetical protein
MNATFFQKIEGILHTERIDAYRQDGADAKLTMARYSLNMALSESLYPALQFSEIALRNTIHQALTARCGTDAWYDSPASKLIPWQKNCVSDAKKSLGNFGKPVTPGRMVAELNFGFWTGFFNKAHGQTGIGHHLAKKAFPHAPANERDLIRLGARWKDIRDLRNRVFHHERILHWKDLNARQQAILEVICWISPELYDLAKAIDRFSAIRRAGLKPWIAKLQRHWPPSTTTPSTSASVSTLEAVPEPFDASNGSETPFGHRWGGDVFSLTAEHITAMQDGQALVLDVMNEYVVFLKSEPAKETTKGEGAGDGE